MEGRQPRRPWPLVTARWSPGDRPLETATAWAAVDAMDEAEVEHRALADPDARPASGAQLACGWWGRFVRVVRERQGLTHEAFADAYAIPLGTLGDWEQGRKLPDAPGRALLRVIQREREAARRSLAG